MSEDRVGDWIEYLQSRSIPTMGMFHWRSVKGSKPKKSQALDFLPRPTAPRARIFPQDDVPNMTLVLRRNNIHQPAPIALQTRCQPKGFQNRNGIAIAQRRRRLQNRSRNRKSHVEKNGQEVPRVGRQRIIATEECNMVSNFAIGVRETASDIHSRKFGAFEHPVQAEWFAGDGVGIGEDSKSQRSVRLSSAEQ